MARQWYYPYGETRYTTGALPTDFGFTGQRAEAGLGLLDYRARYYDPLLGRFINADTIVPEAGNPQDLNRYAYVRHNPLRYTDPSGHWTFEETPNDPYFIPPSELHRDAQRRQDFITPSGPPLTSVASDTGPAEELIRSGADVWELSQGVHELSHGIGLMQGGFRLVEGTTYAGQRLVYGTGEAKTAAGLAPQFTHALRTNPAIIGYTDPLVAAGRAIGGRGSAVTLGIAYGVDIYEYGWGSKRDIGLGSSEFMSAMTVDTVFSLGLPAAGAAIGTAIMPGPGTVIGGGAGAAASVVLSWAFREPAIHVVDQYFWGAAKSAGDVPWYYYGCP
ncbi:MAG: RHS repeat-associated core domain-containing protein [Anaerolineae bacterium]|nr:RHS repeat-associated core domain-containing protein [Anaerolineae bacterium]